MVFSRRTNFYKIGSRLQRTDSFEMPPRKCLYDVLGVPRTIDGADLKKVYRQLALKYHPDKNLEDPERAKNTFQEIQVE